MTGVTATVELLPSGVTYEYQLKATTTTGYSYYSDVLTVDTE